MINLHELGTKIKPYIVVRTLRTTFLMLRLLISNHMAVSKDKVIIIDNGMLKPHLINRGLKEYSANTIYYDASKDRLLPERLREPIIVMGLDNVDIKDIHVFNRYKENLLGAFGYKLTRNSRLLGFTTIKIYETNVNPNLLVMQTGDEILFLEPCEEILCVTSINDQERKALNVIREYIIEFGTLRFPDVVNAVMANLHVPREEARNIVLSLIDKKLVMINKRGEVLLSFTYL